MSPKIVVLIVIIISFVAIGSILLYSSTNSEYLSKTKHEDKSWAVIKDSKGDIIAVETGDSNVWISLKSLNQNQSEMWIGGIIEEYGNYWGFRFEPDSIIIAEITIEGAQSNIKAISQDLDYWIGKWAKQTYVFAKVEEINE